MFDLILDHKNTNAGWFKFNASMPFSGLENQDDLTANTYSIIGYLTNDITLRNTYLDNDNKYTFKLEYRYRYESDQNPQCHETSSLIGFGNKNQNPI